MATSNDFGAPVPGMTRRTQSDWTNIKHILLQAAQVSAESRTGTYICQILDSLSTQMYNMACKLTFTATENRELSREVHQLRQAFHAMHQQFLRHLDNSADERTSISAPQAQAEPKALVS